MRIAWREALLAFLAVLALFRWLMGGDPLDPTTSARGYVQLALLGIASFLAFVWWPADFLKLLVRFAAFLLLPIWTVLTALWSFSPLITAGQGISFLMTLILALFLAHRFRTVCEGARVFLLVLWAIVALGLALNIAYYGTPLYFGPPASYTPLEPGEPERARLVLAADHPLVAGHIFAFIVLLSALHVQKNRTRRGVYILSALFAFGGLLLTNARASLAATLLGLVWQFVLEPLKRKGGKVYVFALMAFFILNALLLSYMLNWADLVSEALYSFAPDFSTLNGRIPLWEAIIREMSLQPELMLLGTGFEATRFLTFYLAPWNPGQAHNAYMEILLGTGVVGGVFALVFWGLAFYELFTSAIGGLLLYWLFLGVFNPNMGPNIPFLVSSVFLFLALYRKPTCVNCQTS